MAVTIQVAFDAHDPEKLADFWALALDYQHQPPPPGFDNWQQFAERMGVPEERWHDVDALVDPAGAKPRLFFQKVPEGKTAKNRVHLDLHVSEGAPDKETAWQRVRAHVDKVVAAGATYVGEHDELGTRWVVMLDPEGNEFCLS